jgi:hypothetical protein
MLISYRANVNACDENGISPLMHALEADDHDEEITMSLVENEADVNHRSTKKAGGMAKGSVPLHFAAANGQVEAPAAAELPVTMASTLKAMQAFAAEHPELGEIQGKTKAAFFANLSEAWANRGYTEATLPVSSTSTLKEMQQFAEMLSSSIGEMPKKSVAKAVFFDDLTARLRASGLLQ